MPIYSEHPAYQDRSSQWTRCRDAYGGNDTVKSKAVEYLPALGGQDGTQYAAYLKRALFYGSTARTVEGVVGAIMRKPPDVELDDKLEEYLDDITDTGIAFDEFAKYVVGELFLTARVGLLIDRKISGGRPYISAYTAENILNWRTDADGNLILVVLRESAWVPKTDDPYEYEKVEQYRELILEDGVYVQRVHTRSEKDTKAGKTDFVVKTVTPTRKGKELDFIPFILVSPNGLVTDAQKPPILDLVDVNLSHYRTSADLEHGRHKLALPTPWVSGVTSSDLPDGKLYLGADSALILPPPEAKAGMLEFTGAGLSELVKAMEEKEQMMARLGARLLFDRRKGVEAAETARINFSGETSVSSSIAAATSYGLTAALKMLSKWEGVSEEGVECKLNKDFVDNRLEPQQMDSLFKVYQGGGISLDTFLWNLQVGEVLPPEREIEDEKELIEAGKNDIMGTDVPPKSAEEVVRKQTEDTTEDETEDDAE